MKTDDRPAAGNRRHGKSIEGRRRDYYCWPGPLLEKFAQIFRANYGYVVIIIIRHLFITVCKISSDNAAGKPVGRRNADIF